ncbi:alpha/beta-type small acid-soluble spore protein [Proteinivorax hydrogeniformans]|uniref:Alpha/beta-type small acid-soluble spore protein n=1 Tax=Proteinivorax hydrogeniformans TaxID=1826727 RepID=A0AAU8HPW8_9FIRM
MRTERQQGFESQKVLVPQAEQALENLKNEVATELGLNQKIQTQGYANMSPYEVGQIGGQMVKRLIEMAESNMSNGTTPKPATMQESPSTQQITQQTQQTQQNQMS